MNQFRWVFQVACLWVVGLLFSHLLALEHVDSLDLDTLIQNKGFSGTAVYLDQQLHAVDKLRDKQRWALILIKRARLKALQLQYKPAVEYLKVQRWPEDALSQVMLKLSLAHELEVYLGTTQSQSLELADSSVSISSQLSFHYKQIHSGYLSAYKIAYKEQLSLQQAKPFLTQGEYPVKVLGHVADLVAIRWMRFLADDLYWSLGQQKQHRKLPLPYLLNLTEIDILSARTLHPLVQIQRISTHLQQWHQAAGRYEAAFEVSRFYITLLQRHFPEVQDLQLMSDFLQGEVDQLGAQYSWWAMGQYQLATMKQKMSHPSALLEAHELAVQASFVHPNSIGAQRSRQLLSELEYQEFSVSGKRSSGLGQASLRVRYRNLSRLYFRAWKVAEPLPTSLNEAQKQAVVKELLQQPFSVAWHAELSDYSDLHHHEVQLVPKIEEYGQWLLMVSPQAEFADVPSKLQLLNLHLSRYVASVSYDKGEFRVAVYEGKKGRALPNMSVELLKVDGKKTQRLKTSRTNVHGMAKLKTEVQAAHYQVSIREGDKRSLVDVPDLQLAQQVVGVTKPVITAQLLTGKVSYIEGEAIPWSILAVNETQDTKPSAYANQAGWVGLYSMDHTLLERQYFTTNPAGLASGVFQRNRHQLSAGRWYLKSSWQVQQLIQVSEKKDVPQLSAIHDGTAVKSALSNTLPDILSIHSKRAFFDTQAAITLQLRRTNSYDEGRSGRSQWFLYRLMPVQTPTTSHKPQPHALQAMSWVTGALQQHGEVGHNSPGDAALMLSKLPVGRYRIRAMEAQKTGQAIAAEYDFMVVKRGLNKALDEESILLAQQSTITTGNSLQLLAGSNVKGQWSRLSVLQAGQQLASQMLSPGIHLLEFPILDKHQGGVRFYLEWVMDNHLYHKEIAVKVPWSRQQLKLSLNQSIGSHDSAQLSVDVVGNQPLDKDAQVVVYYHEVSSTVPEPATFFDMSQFDRQDRGNTIRLDNNGTSYPYYFRGAQRLAVSTIHPLKHPDILYSQRNNDAFSGVVSDYEVLPINEVQLESPLSKVSLAAAPQVTLNRVEGGNVASSPKPRYVQFGALNAQGKFLLRIPEALKGKAVQANITVITPALGSGQLSVVLR